MKNNMREIKFRAVNGKGEMAFWDLTHPDCDKFAALDNVMQYTGLQDKNGKEIYEGDVLRNTWFSSEQIGRVVILPTGVRLEHNDGLTGEFFTSPLWLNKEMEVIGNIYEHPELLK